MDEKFELDKEGWSKAILEAQSSEQTMISYSVLNKLFRIKEQGLDAMLKNDIKYVDALYPFLPATEQLKVKKFLMEKFDLINKTPYADELKVLRAKYNLTQQRMSEITGIPIRTIQGWELGERNPAEYMLDLIETKLKDFFA